MKLLHLTNALAKKLYRDINSKDWYAFYYDLVSGNDFLSDAIMQPRESWEQLRWEVTCRKTQPMKIKNFFANEEICRSDYWENLTMITSLSSMRKKLRIIKVSGKQSTPFCPPKSSIFR